LSVKSKGACERCGAPIEWVVMRDGERLDVDATPVLAPEHTGAAIVAAAADSEGDMTDGRMLREVAGELPGLGLFLPHLLTCRSAGRGGAPRPARAAGG
jgi:hypothetical protein